MVVTWRIATNVSEIEVSSDQRSLSGTDALGDDLIGCCPKADIPYKLGYVAKLLHDCDRRARQVRVQEKSHGRSGSRERVEGLFGCEVGRELQGGTDIVDGEVILPLDIFECHTVGKAPDHDGHGHPGAPDDRFAVQHGGIDDDTAPNIHSNTMITLSCVPLSELRYAIQVSHFLALIPVHIEHLEKLSSLPSVMKSLEL